MSLNQKELKARMMAEAEAVIDKLSAGASEKEEMQLSDIVHLTRAVGQLSSRLL